jgi:hypothetical protein
MTISHELSKNRKGNIISVVEGVNTEQQINSLIHVCHTLAIAFLISKVTARKLNTEFIGLKLTDIAYDCIVDLFQRDTEGGNILYSV